jgi:AraC family transcriptional regulator of adaptative response/methylated-DNA-[protein]-cysteine methyltransferase
MPVPEAVRAKEIADEGELWRAVVQRDETGSVPFVYAVETTGVFCRPGCPSRTPRRRNVRFFPSADEARRGGFRSCRRCNPDAPASDSDPRARTILAVCRFMADAGRVPTLRELARHVGLSEGYLHRLFKRRLGLTPRAYADALRSGRLREKLRADGSITRALYEAGYGSPSRLYEDRSARLGMTPGSYRRGAAGVRIRYAVTQCQLGRLLVAMTDRGVCFVALGDRVADVEEELRDQFPKARLERDDGSVGRVLDSVVEHVGRRGPLPPVPLDIQATAFQRRVWDELQRIPPGETRTYAELARAAGQPKAVRAVAKACAQNPVALVIPCHRVVRSDGSRGGYRWGQKRKARLLGLEKGGPHRDRTERGVAKGHARRRPR